MDLRVLLLKLDPERVLEVVQVLGQPWREVLSLVFPRIAELAGFQYSQYVPCVMMASDYPSCFPVSPFRITKSRRLLYSSARFRTSSSRSVHSVIVQYL